LAATGNPNAGRPPAWTAVVPAGGADTLLTMDAAPQQLTNYRADKCAFWASYGLVTGG